MSTNRMGPWESAARAWFSADEALVHLPMLMVWGPFALPWLAFDEAFIHAPTIAMARAIDESAEDRVK